MTAQALDTDQAKTVGVVVIVAVVLIGFLISAIITAIVGRIIVILVVGALVAIYPPQKKIQLGLDLRGGTEFLIRLVKENPDAKLSAQARETAVEGIRSRVDQYGVGEPSINPVGEDSILVQIPGLDAERINEVRTTLQRVAKLEFRLVDPQGPAVIAGVEAGRDIVPPGYQIVAGEDEENEAVNATKSTDDKKKPTTASKKQTEKLLVTGWPSCSTARSFRLPGSTARSTANA